MRVWGASPAGQIYDQAGRPGTRDFFEKVKFLRDEEEQPWLPSLVPFGSTRGTQVLEVGFGAGFDALKFCRAGAIYTGIDVTPENVERAAAHLGMYDFAPALIQGDAEQLPFENGVFDAYFSNGVLHHVESLSQALREAYRVLKLDGRLWVTVYHRRSIFYVGTLFGEHWILRGDRHRFRSFRDRVAEIEYTTADAAPLVNVYTRGRDSKGPPSGRFLRRQRERAQAHAGRPASLASPA